jgi:predicted nucleotidyltransferase
MNPDPTAINRSMIEAFCTKWKVAEFSLFGSAILADFGPESDARWSYFELFDMQDELEAVFGRQVDLVTTGALKNPFRRAEILGTRRVLYAA